MTVKELIDALNKLVEQDVTNLDREVMAESEIRRMHIFNVEGSIHVDLNRPDKRAVVILELVG